MRKLTFVVTLVAMLAAVLAAPASAGGNGVTQISGVANFADESECTDIPEAGFDFLTLIFREGNGSLEGCWFTKLGSSTATKSGVVHETGEEIFIGTLDGEPVEFRTTYRFTGKFDSEGNEIHGRCQHPIVGGDVTGRVDIKDDVVTGDLYYRGHVKFTNG